MMLSREEIRAQELALERWYYAKLLVEPRIQEASNDETALGLLPNHEETINCYKKMLCIVKCRKTAQSWAFALDALMRAFTEPNSTSVIISIDEKEAKEKAKFISWIYNVLPKEVKREFKMEGGTEERRFKDPLGNQAFIEFSTHKPPTGKGAAVYLDEFAVETQSGVTKEELLVGAIGCTTHAGYIRVASTERGPETLFHKIVTGDVGQVEDMEDMPDTSWEIGYFPWWRSPALCVDIEEAERNAPNMQTLERVRRYGNHKLKEQFQANTGTLGLEKFQREFECIVLDDKESYFDIDLIRACQAKGSYTFYSTEAQGKAEVFKAKRIIDELEDDIRTGNLRGEFAAALDVGRDHDRSELIIGHNLPEDRTHLMVRAIITMNKMPFPEQQEVWDYAMAKIPTTKGYVDGTRGSIGRQLAEWALAKYNQRAMTFEFTPSSKQIVVTGARSRMEKSGITIPDFEPLRTQMLAIKKKTTASGNVIFDAERNKFGHADKAMSLFMLCDLFEQPETGYAFRPTVVGKPTSAPSGMRQIPSGLLLPHRTKVFGV